MESEGKSRGFWAKEKAATRPPSQLENREASLASGAPCPPAGFPRSTFGDGGLSCRVRNGIGRSPPPRLRSREMLPRVSVDAPGRPVRGALASACARRIRRGDLRRLRSRGIRARAISSARLSTSPCLQLRPIDQMVYLGPYQKGSSSRRRLPT